MQQEKTLTCVECGTTFLWLSAEQAPAPARPDHCPMCRRLLPAAARRRGVVKWFSQAKGYGFLTPVEGADVFVHKSGLAAGQETLRAGQLVEFTDGRGPRGAQAEDVILLEVEP